MDITYIVTALVVILVSMTLHEFMHGFVAYKLGDETPRLMGRLTLNPLKHIDPVLTIGLPVLIILSSALTGAQLPIFGGAKPVPFQPGNVRYSEWGVALMALAGPFTNLLIAFISYGLLVLFQVPEATFAGQLLVAFVWVNLGFFAFNILPIPPLDGSRALYAIAPDGVRRFLELVERYGLILVFILVFLGSALLYRYMGVVISWILSVFSAVFGA